MHRADGAFDQIRPVEERFDLYVGGQRFTDGLHFHLHFAHHLKTIGAFQHHDYAADGFFLAVVGEGPIAYRSAELHLRYVAYENGHAIRIRFDNDITNVFQARYQADTPDKISVRFFIDVGSAGVLVVFTQSIEYVRDGHAHRPQAVGIYRHFVLFEDAAETIDLGNTGRSI